MLVFGGDLVVHDLDHVAHRDDADQLPFLQNRDLGDPALAHLAHDLVDVVQDIASDGIGSHHLGNADPAKPFTAVVNNPQNIAFSEDANQPALLVEHGK